MTEEFDGYVTKYALSVGIRLARLRVCENASMTEVVGAKYHTYFHGEGKDWHRTMESAVARANDMRDKKIASLRKSIANMEALRFEVPE